MLLNQLVLLQETKVTVKTNLNDIRVAVVDNLADAALLVYQNILLLQLIKLLAEDQFLRSECDLLGTGPLPRRRLPRGR